MTFTTPSEDEAMNIHQDWHNEHRTDFPTDDGWGEEDMRPLQSGRITSRNMVSGETSRVAGNMEAFLATLTEAQREAFRAL